jgi:hypothetical protein
MKRDEVISQLQIIKDKGNRALQLLDSKPLTAATKAEIQDLARWLKEELLSEYKRMSPAGVQKTMTMFELSIYSPTIEEAWTDTGINRLKVDALPVQNG